MNAAAPARRPGHAGFPVLARVLTYGSLYLINLLTARSGLMIALTFPCLVLCLCAALTIRRKYVGIPDVVILVTFVYYVLRPLQAIDGNAFRLDGIGLDSPTGSTIYSSGQFVMAFAGCYIFLICAIPAFLKFNAATDFKYNSTFADRTLLGLTVLAGVVLALHVQSIGGLHNALAPRYEKENMDAVPPWATAYLGTQIACTTIVMAALRVRASALRLVLAAAVLALQLVSVNPFNNSRAALLAVYVPIGLTFIKGAIRPAPFFILSLVFMLGVMPVLNTTTRGDEKSTGLEITRNANPLAIPFVDVFDMTLANVDYTQRHGMAWGGKLLGDVLFVVPRAVWPGKPTLYGLDVGGELLARRETGTDNLSMPLYGDGYRDFGLLGYFAGSVLFFLFVYLGAYWPRGLVEGLPVNRFIVLASVPIVMRGPFSSTFPLVFFQTLAFLVLARLFGRRRPVAPVPTVPARAG